MPPPLDNPFVMIAVVIGLVILVYAAKTSRKAKAQLEQTRERKKNDCRC